MRITEEFFKNKSQIDIAKSILGLELVYEIDEKNIVSGIINEVELYTQDDEASHSFNGKRTKRNNSMFKKAGHLYVYFTYGMYHCINIVIGDEDIGEAVLIRSIILNKGIDIAIKNRYGIDKDKDNISKIQFKNLSNGPSKLAIAFGINKDFDGINLLDNNSKIYLNDVDYINKNNVKIKEDKRIGISKNKEFDWRFYF